MIKCRKCGNYKEQSEYSQSPKAKQAGRSNLCKKCNSDSTNAGRGDRNIKDNAVSAIAYAEAGGFEEFDKLPKYGEERRALRAAALAQYVAANDTPPPKERPSTTEVQDLHQRNKKLLKVKYADLDTENAQNDDLVPTDRVLYDCVDFTYPQLGRKLGETISLAIRGLELGQTMNPLARPKVMHSRTFHNATKPDIKALEDRGFEMMRKLYACDRLTFESGRPSEWMRRATSHMMKYVIDKLADEWNAALLPE